MSNNKGANKYAHLMTPPKSLKLEFTKAADYDRVNFMFDKGLLKKIDPLGYVAKRLDADFRRAVNGGSTVILGDENDHVRTLVMNYQMHEDRTAPKTDPHDYTELGSVMAVIQGYKSAFLLAAAIGLKEWWAHPPQKKLVTEIKHSNLAPIAIYKALGWVPVTDTQEVDDLFYLCYENVADDQGNAISGPPMSEKSDIGFYQQIDSTLAAEAQVILEFINQGGLKNKHGDFIPVDFSGLDDVGLTRPRLEAIAKGETSKDKLLKIGGGGAALSAKPAP